MKKTLIIALCCFFILASQLVAQSVSGQSSGTTNTNASVNAQAEDADANVSTEKPDPSINRVPAALKPLLLIPLAGVLYLVYEKLAQRNT